MSRAELKALYAHAVGLVQHIEALLEQEEQDATGAPVVEEPEQAFDPVRDRRVFGRKLRQPVEGPARGAPRAESGALPPSA